VARAELSDLPLYEPVTWWMSKDGSVHLWQDCAADLTPVVASAAEVLSRGKCCRACQRKLLTAPTWSVSDFPVSNWQAWATAVIALGQCQSSASKGHRVGVPISGLHLVLLALGRLSRHAAQGDIYERLVALRAQSASYDIERSLRSCLMPRGGTYPLLPAEGSYLEAAARTVRDLRVPHQIWREHAPEGTRGQDASVVADRWVQDGGIPVSWNLRNLEAELSERVAQLDARIDGFQSVVILKIPVAPDERLVPDETIRTWQLPSGDFGALQSVPLHRALSMRFGGARDHWTFVLGPEEGHDVLFLTMSLFMGQQDQGPTETASSYEYRLQQCYLVAKTLVT
jgi:hypothetical protein